MRNCPYCGAKEEKHTPLCSSCGSLRYPIEKKLPSHIDKQQTLKTSASLAIAIVTPGSLIVLAFMGIKRINEKIKNRRISSSSNVMQTPTDYENALKEKHTNKDS